MASYSLYRICILKISRLLQIKYWNSLHVNPFSRLPTIYVEDIVEFVMNNRKFYFDLDLINIFRPLLTSGRIRNLNASLWNTRAQYDFLMELLTEDYCKNLVSLFLPVPPVSYSKIQSIILWGPNLVKLHLPIFVDLNIFENCTHLRILRFHNWNEATEDYFSADVIEIPPVIKNLEVFSVADSNFDINIMDRIIDTLLWNCPNLTSIGYCNSLRVFENWHSTTLKLKRTVWEMEMRKMTQVIPCPQKSDFQSWIPENDLKIQNAVLSCPLVEELVLFPFSGSCFQYLELLENLSLLCINIEYFYDDLWPPLMILLRQIGPRLRHFSLKALSCYRPSLIFIPIDIILSLCPNLISFETCTKVTVSNPENIGIATYPLKRFYINVVDSETLEFIASTCPNITELIFHDTNCLDDSLAKKILSRGGFTKLEVFSIDICRFSEGGLVKFLESVPSMERVNFNHFADVKARKPSTIMNAWIIRMGRHMEVDMTLKKEFFKQKLHICHF